MSYKCKVKRCKFSTPKRKLIRNHIRTEHKSVFRDQRANADSIAPNTKYGKHMFPMNEFYEKVN